MRDARAIGALLALAVIVAGCRGADSLQFTHPQREARGLVFVLPGIEGEGPSSYAVRAGLDEAGVDHAIPIYRWGRPLPGVGLLLNQVDVAGNREAGRRIARLIVQYQDAHPGCPVHMVGHSGGGGVAVFTLESLPAGRYVDGVVLLNASISAGYDLSRALARTRKGIVNFWSPGDVGLLVIGTTVLGNVDGVHGPAAGATGFTNARNNSGKLYQVQWSPSMATAGNIGGHMDSTGQPFVAQWVAPWVLADSWTPPPASGATAIARP